MTEVKDFFEGDKQDPAKEFEAKFNPIRFNFSKLVVILLFLVGLTLSFVGLLSLLKTWELVLNVFGVPLQIINLESDGNLLHMIVESFGSLMAGYLIVSLARSILTEQVLIGKEQGVKNMVRENMSIVLPIFVIAFAVEFFNAITRIGGSEPNTLWQLGASVVLFVSMLWGWNYYMKNSKRLPSSLKSV